MNRVSVPSTPASTRAMMRSTRPQLWAASWNWAKRRTLPRTGRRLEARGGALLQCCNMGTECCIGGQAEDPLHPVLPAPVEHLRASIMAVGTQQDLDLWPMAAQGTDQTAHKPADLDSARPLAG